MQYTAGFSNRTEFFPSRHHVANDCVSYFMLRMANSIVKELSGEKKKKKKATHSHTRTQH